jgi:adenylate kinase family enzyme
MQKTSQQPLVVFMLGDPTSGKSTHAQLLAKKYGMHYCDVGSELDRLRKVDAAVDKALRRTYDKGHLAPTRIVRTMYRRVVARLPKSKGVVFGGNPKMLGEARLLYKLFRDSGRTNFLCVYLTIPLAEIRRRTQNRPGYTKGARRTMDTQTALKNRLSFWNKNVSAVVKYWKTKIPFVTLSSNGPTPQIHKKLLSKLKPYM